MITDRLGPYELATALDSCNQNETCRNCRYMTKDYNCVSKLMGDAADMIRKQQDLITELDNSRMMQNM